MDASVRQRDTRGGSTMSHSRCQPISRLYLGRHFSCQPEMNGKISLRV
jgi:hypothetical protein